MTFYHLELALFKKNKMIGHKELTTSNPEVDTQDFLYQHRYLGLHHTGWTVAKGYEKAEGIRLESPSYPSVVLTIILHELKPVNPQQVLRLFV